MKSIQIFTEMERTLIDEIDFLREAQSANKVAAAVAHLPNNQPVTPPVLVPLPITGLVSRRVLVMEYIEGTALSKMPGAVLSLSYNQMSLNHKMTIRYSMYVCTRGDGQERHRGRLHRVEDFWEEAFVVADRCLWVHDIWQWHYTRRPPSRFISPPMTDFKCHDSGIAYC